MLSCVQTVAQASERLPIVNDRLPGCWPVGRAKPQSDHHALNWLPSPLVMPVSQRLECGSHAHDPARGTPLTMLVAEMLEVLATILETVKNE